MDYTQVLDSLRKEKNLAEEDKREPVEQDIFTKAVEEALTSPKGLVIAAITSNTQASFESDMTPYGAGKTTLMLKLMYHFNHFDPETQRYYDDNLDIDDPANWEACKNQLWYYPSRILRAMDKAVKEHRRMLAGGWDDVQYTAGAKTGLPAAIEELVGDLTTDRPEIGVLFLTMPNAMSIAAALRSLIQYELIVHSRGRFEIQRVSYRKNFQNPKKDWQRLEYISGLGSDEKEAPDFTPLPYQMQKWYDDWRSEQKAYKRRRTIQTLEKFEKIGPPPGEETENEETGEQVQAEPVQTTGWGE